MNYFPKVTVVTIVKNDPQGFLITANSIIKQDYSNIEWIVVDGLSTDHTVHYIKAYRDRISTCIIEKDEGIYHAMNKGIDNANGEWMFFMNADDAFFDKSTVSKYVGALMNCDDIIYSSAQRREDGKLHNYRSEDKYWLGMWLDHQTVFAKVSIYKELRFDTTYKIAADYDFFSRAKNKRYTFRKIENLTGCKKPFSEGVSSDYFKRQKERIRVIKSNFSSMPFKMVLTNEYNKHLVSNNLSSAQYEQLMKEL